MHSPTGAPMYDQSKVDAVKNKIAMTPPTPNAHQNAQPSIPTMNNQPQNTGSANNLVNFDQGNPSRILNPNTNLMLSAISRGIGGDNNANNPNTGTITQPVQGAPRTAMGSMSRFAYPTTGALPNGNV